MSPCLSQLPPRRVVRQADRKQGNTFTCPQLLSTGNQGFSPIPPGVARSLNDHPGVTYDLVHIAAHLTGG
ncbi:MAG: hypothetical protein VX667_08715, partial [Nitrospinota bacterium]|nr:hypothetical protein [Nitrospinota bacterium]